LCLDSTMQTVTAGRFIGAGQSKDCYEVQELPDIVALVGPLDVLRSERWYLGRLRNMGIPVPETKGMTKIKINGKKYHCLLQERMACALEEGTLGARAVRSLKRIRALILKHQIWVLDLQFLLDWDGSVVVHDPYMVRKVKSQGQALAGLHYLDEALKVASTHA
jgi:hypothetical protein